MYDMARGDKSNNSGMVDKIESFVTYTKIRGIQLGFIAREVVDT